MDPKSLELASPLQILPPVEFCCAYGSSLLSNNNDKTSMVDYILGVLDPIEWHSKNLERNRHHYSKLMAGLGPKALAWVANRIGAGVHFNPFVEWKNKEIKYGVVGVQDLAREVLTWDKFFLCGRLQKPVCRCLRCAWWIWLSCLIVATTLYYLHLVHVIVDNWDIRKVNLVNLKSATSAALLLLPPEFSEEDLYAKICSLSYTGDLRMFFAEDKNKVNKIVRGSFESFRTMYSPMLQEYAVEGLLQSHTLSAHQKSFKQDCGLSATSSLFSTVLCTTQNQMGPKLQLNKESVKMGSVTSQILVSSREEATNFVRKALRRKVMVSSTRQAVSGFLAAGGATAARYVARKISKAWKSRTS